MPISALQGNAYRARRMHKDPLGGYFDSEGNWWSSARAFYEQYKCYRKADQQRKRWQRRRLALAEVKADQQRERWQRRRLP